LQLHKEKDDALTGNLFGESEEAKTTTFSGEPVPCGECNYCQKALSGNWIDFTEISPEEGTDGKVGTIKIEPLREIVARQGFGPTEGRFKFVLIQQAERLTPQAANSILKVIEEPPEGWFFLLTASDSSLVLPTITSRCQKLHLDPLPVENVQNQLIEEGVEPQRANICARLAKGSIDRASSLADEENWEKRDWILGFLEKPDQEVNRVADWASQRYNSLQLTLDQIESLIGDLLKWSVSSNENPETPHLWLNSDASVQLEAHAAQMTHRCGDSRAARAFWLDRADDVARIRRISSAPLNRKALVQDLLFPWLTIL